MLDWAGTPTTVHAGWIGRPGGLYLHLEGTLGSATVQAGDLTVRTEHVSTEAGEPPRAGAALAAFLSDRRGQKSWLTPTTRDAIATAQLLDSVTKIATPRS